MATTVRRAAGILAVAVLLVVAAGLLSGSFALVTTYGTSMAPRINAGDLVVVRRAAYEVGEVVAYRSPQLEQVVLHRIIAQERRRYLFQGDNNDFVDPERLTMEDILGQEWLHIPGAGRWLQVVRSGPVLGAAVLLIISWGTGVSSRVRRRRRKDRRIMPDPQPSAGARVPWPRWTRELSGAMTAFGAPVRQLMLGAVVIGLLALLLGAVAWTRPAWSTGSPRMVDAAFRFSYTAQTPSSDGAGVRAVTAPQSVMWSTAANFDVSYHYEGQPGTVSVDAELSTPDGWRSTVPLAAPTRFTGGSYDETVRLDLLDLRARADAAAAASGAAPPQAVDVSVIPRVVLDGGGVLAAELALSLESLQLAFSHVGDATGTAADEARNSADDPLAVQLSTSSPARVPATLTLWRRTIGVATARVVSLIALAAAAAVATALTLMVRRTSPAPEDVRIARKYGDLLVPVLPTDVGSGAGIIDVLGIEPLTGLAKSYGLPVLHWSRGEETTYIVHDEDTAYRYRAAVRVHETPGQEPPSRWSISLGSLTGPPAEPTLRAVSR